MRILNQQEEIRNIAAKSRIILAAVFLSTVFLAARLAYLQIYRGEEFLEKSKRNYLLREKVFPPRGDIISSDGVILATTIPKFRIQILPALFADEETVEENILRLASVLSLSDAQVSELSEYFTTCKGICRHSPIIIKDEISKQEMLRLAIYLADIPGTIISSFYRRFYPRGVTDAHVTGYVSRVAKEDVGRNPDYDAESFVGKTGIERSWEKELHGRYGEMWHVIDYVGRRIEISRMPTDDLPPPAPAHKGNTIETGILSYLQEEAAVGLGDRPGAAVVMNIHTGEILALYSSPSYDPNLLARRRIPSNIWREYSESVLRPLTNKVTQESFFPGSTFKVIPALAGLEYRVITPGTSFLCTGCLLFETETKCCWNKWGHGYTTLYRGIKESCDVYFYVLSERLGHRRLTEFARVFNVGRQTGVDLPVEEDGILPTVEWFTQNHPGQRMNPGYTMNLAIGQGDVRMTPLQIAVVYAAIANGGRIVRPHIVTAVIDDKGVRRAIEPETLRILDISEKNRREILRSLWGVVNEAGGTAFAYADHTIPLAAGKTGTSQVISKEERRRIDILDEDRYAMTTDDALFVALFPYSQPRIVVVAVVQSGARGGEVAAPIAYRLLKAYYYGGRRE